jgi:hypothetical protein
MIEHADARGQDVGLEAEHGQLDKAIVVVPGRDDADIHAAEGGELEGGDELFVGDEVGAGDPDAAFGGVDGVEEEERAGFEFVCRT